MNKRIDTAVIGFLSLIVGIFFYRTIVFGLLPVPTDALVGLYHPWRDLYAGTNPRGVPFKNFLITDPVRQQIPWRKLAIDSWKEGRVPWWNPYSFSGAPLLANIQAAALYPANILFFLFSFSTAWTILIILQPLMAMIFFYLYARSMEIHPAAAMTGSLSWGLGGFSIAWLTWGTIGHVALWLPLILYAIEKKKSVLFAAAIAFQMFAGHAQISLYVLGVVILYSVFRKKILWVPMLAGLVIAAIQWIPFLQLSAASGRLGDALASQKLGWFLPWQHLVQFVIPDFFGNPATLNYWGVWNYGEFIGYVGIVGIFFAALSLRSALPIAGFFQVLLLGAFLFMLPNPISKLPFILHIPVLSVLQPTRLMVVASFSLSMLAAIGMHRWLIAKHIAVWRYISTFAVLFLAFWVMYFVLPLPWDALTRNLTIRNSILPTFTLVAVLSAVAAAYFFHRKRLIHWGMVGVLIGLAVFDLVRFGWKFTSFTPREYFFPETSVITFLKELPKPFRVLSLDDRILPPNTSAYYGLENTEGYDPLFSKRYQEFMGTLQTGDPEKAKLYDFNRIVLIKNTASPLFTILGPDYVLSIDELAGPEFKKVFEEGATKVYKNLSALPRVFLVLEAKTVPMSDVLSELGKDSFHGEYQAIVEEDLGLTDRLLSNMETADIEHYDKGNMQIKTKTEENRLLVIMQPYSSLMRVFIDGKETKVYPTNYIFSGVVVPAGTHTVNISYSL